MKLVWRAAMGMLALLFLPGCATQHLWTASRFSDKYTPATQMHLQIYKLPSDFLAVYDEWSPRGDVIRRAYFLRIKDPSPKPKKPRFVQASLGQMGQAIPIFDQNPGTDTVTNGTWCLKVAPLGFELYDGGAYLGGFELPVYRDAGNTTAQVMITPLAVAADVTVVAGVIWLMTASHVDCDLPPYRTYPRHAR